MVLFGVPILFHIALPIFDVLVFVFFLSPLVIKIVFTPILLVHLLVALSPEKLLPGLALLSVMFISVDEVLIVRRCPHLLSDPFLLLLKLVLHPLPLPLLLLPVLPVVVRILILKVAPRRLPEYKLIILRSLLRIAHDRVGLSDALEHLLLLLLSIFSSRGLLRVRMVFLG